MLSKIFEVHCTGSAMAMHNVACYESDLRHTGVFVILFAISKLWVLKIRDASILH